MNVEIQVLTLSVHDVERALDFYTARLGFHLSVDYFPNPAFRVVQVTPPGSSTFIQFGVGLADAAPGSARDNYLMVNDIVAAHAQLRAADVDPGALVHKRPVEDWRGQTAPGIDPQRRDYASFFEFADPDGNTWRVQEIGAV